MLKTIERRPCASDATGSSRLLSHFCDPRELPGAARKIAITPEAEASHFTARNKSLEVFPKLSFPARREAAREGNPSAARLRGE